MIGPSRRLLAILALIFFGLLGLVMIQSAQPAPLPTPDRTVTRLFPELTVLDIAAVRLRDPNSNASFIISRAADGTWTAPDHSGELDAATATNIARTIVLMPVERRLPLSAGANLRDYGFRPYGRLSIEVLRGDGGSHAIAVGGLVPSNLAYYALVDDEPDIALITRGAIDYLITLVRDQPVNRQ
jgi:hypothetical protein